MSIEYESNDPINRRLRRLERNLWMWRVLAIIFSACTLTALWVIGMVLLPKHKWIWPFWQ